MNQDQTRRPVQITREELYRQVWETPMIRLGEKYGVSGNGLKKICDRLDVPYPPAGYWAKLHAGKSVMAAALPEAKPGTPPEVRISPTPPPTRAPKLDPTLAEKLSKASAAAAAVAVPDALRRPHPAIAAWIAEHDRRVAADKRDRSLYGTTFQTKPFTDLDRRQQRILDTIFKELEKREFKVTGTAPHNVAIAIGKEQVEFTLRERIRQVRRPLNDEERARGYYGQFRQEKLPTGELIFVLKTHLAPGLTTEWRDGERPLEEQVGDILSVLSLAGPILQEKRRQAEEAERRRWEEERRREEARAKRQQDKNCWRRFLELAGRWEDAALASRFIEALEEQLGDADEKFGGRTVAEWLAWARESRDKYDPLRGDRGAIWSNIASVTSWEYRD